MLHASSSLGFRAAILACLLFMPTSIFAEVTAASERYEFLYKVDLNLPTGKNVVKLWLPHPAETQFQKVNHVDVDSPFSWQRNHERKFGNQILYFEGTTQTSPLTFRVKYDVTRFYETTHKWNPKDASSSWSKPDLFLGEDRLVPMIPLFRKISRQITQSPMSEEGKIRALFEYVVKSMRYDKTGAGWGNGDAVWACKNKRGNCTDFHSLFIGLSRSLGIPARFVVGVPIQAGVSEGSIPGYHCWAHAFSKLSGWVPVDASEAKKNDSIDPYFGQLPPDRIEFSQGRDIQLAPKQRGVALNYFIYPYAEVNGKKLETVSKELSFRRISPALAGQTTAAVSRPIQ